MANDFLGRRTSFLQHVLDQVNAPARAVEFVAKQLKRRTGCGAQAAMHAGAQNLVRRRGFRIAQLRFAEIGLHAAKPPPPAHPRRGRSASRALRALRPLPSRARRPLSSRARRTLSLRARRTLSSRGAERRGELGVPSEGGCFASLAMTRAFAMTGAVAMTGAFAMTEALAGD